MCSLVGKGIHADADAIAEIERLEKQLGDLTKGKEAKP